MKDVQQREDQRNEEIKSDKADVSATLPVKNQSNHEVLTKE